MRHRHLAAAVLLALAACGGDDDSSVDRDLSSTTPTGPATSVPATVPATTDGPLLQLERRVVVSADGDVYRRTDPPEGFAPPIPDRPAAWEVATLTDRGMDDLRGIIERLGFLEPPPDYGGLFVSDTDPFRLVVTVDGTEQVHELFMPEERLGDPSADAARGRLAELVSTLDDLDGAMGDELGPFAPYLPESWRVTAVRGGSSEAPAWPFTAPAAEGCTMFAGEDVTAAGLDAATGRYRDPAGAGDLDVDALLPWETC